MNNTIPTIETERLLLDAFNADDAPDYQHMVGDPDISVQMANIPYPYPDGMAESWIATHGPEWLEGKGLSLAIRLKSGGELIGFISLTNIHTGHRAELAYWISKPLWGRGYCTEATEAIVKYAFDEMGLLRVFAFHTGRNPASGRVMEKIGMSCEGRMIDHAFKNDRFDDVVIHGILNRKYQK